MSCNTTEEKKIYTVVFKVLFRRKTFPIKFKVFNI